MVPEQGFMTVKLKLEGATSEELPYVIPFMTKLVI